MFSRSRKAHEKDPDVHVKKVGHAKRNWQGLHSSQEVLRPWPSRFHGINAGGGGRYAGLKEIDGDGATFVETVVGRDRR